MTNRFSKPVAFNRTNANDKRIFNYPAARRNFSGFAKKAMLEKIERDEQKRKEKKAVISAKKQPYHHEEPTNAERIDQMRQQIEQKKTEKNPSPKMFF